MTRDEYLKYFQNNWPTVDPDRSHSLRFSAIRKCVCDAAEKYISDASIKTRVCNLAKGNCLRAMEMAFLYGVPPKAIGPAAMLIVNSGPTGRHPNYTYSKREMKP